MAGKEAKDLSVIKGFKVMEWLREARAEAYALHAKDPAEYFRRIRVYEKEVEQRLNRRKTKQNSDPEGISRWL